MKVLFEFIVLFFPGILSSALSFFHAKTADEGINRNVFNIIGTLIFYVLLDNLLSLSLFSKIACLSPAISNGHLSPAFLSLHYLLLAFMVGLGAGLIGMIIRMNIRLSLCAQSNNPDNQKEIRP